MEAQFQLITDQLSGLAESVKDIHKILLDQNKKIDSCMTTITILQKENSFMQTRISELEKQVKPLNSMELYCEFKSRIDREKNVIMYGVDEILDLEVAVKDILQLTLNQANVSFKKFYRIGKAQNRSNPRPVKIEFSSKESALLVLRNKDKLPKVKYPNVKVANDYTPRQKEELSLVFQELDNRKAKGENIKIKFINGHPQIVPIITTKRGRDEESSPNQSTLKINKTSTSTKN